MTNENRKKRKKIFNKDAHRYRRKQRKFDVADILKIIKQKVTNKLLLHVFQTIEEKLNHPIETLTIDVNRLQTFEN